MAHPDGKPNLYRTGAYAFWSGNLRLHDIPVVNGKVQPGTGGISAFSQNDPNWQHNKTWVVPFDTSLDTTNLKAVHGIGTHWSLEPSRAMTLEEDKAALNAVSAKALPFHQLRVEGLELPHQSDHPSKAVRFVFEALSAVVRDKTHITGWDENDYTHLAILAKSLHAREIELSALVCQSGSPLLKDQALVAAAALAYIKTMDAKCERTGDEDEEADWGNDRSLLRNALNLKGRPLFADET